MLNLESPRKKPIHLFKNNLVQKGTQQVTFLMFEIFRCTEG